MAEEFCASQSSSPRRASSYRRADFAPACDIARLDASLRNAASLISCLRRQLQQQRRQFPDSHFHAHHPPQQKAETPPRPPQSPPNDGKTATKNARQRRSTRRATQRWHQRENSSSLEEILSSPISTSNDEATAGAYPVFIGTALSAVSTATAASSRQQCVSDSTVREMPEPTQLPPVSAQPYTPAWQQQTAPISLTPKAVQLTLAPLVAPRRHQPAAEGKRRALEGPPGLNPPQPPIPSTLPPTAGPAIRSPHPDRSSPRLPRHHRRFTPYPAASPAHNPPRPPTHSRARRGV